MLLTNDELAEVDIYLYELAKYRETFQELKDHVITALLHCNSPDFDIQLVKDIIYEDFGGREQVVKHEAIYQKNITARFFSLLGAEMLNTFKWPGILSNLPNFALCAILYYAHQPLANLASSPMLKAMYILFYLPGLFFLYQKFVHDRFRKESILYDFLYKASLLTILSGTLMLRGIGYSQTYFEYNQKLELLFFLIMFMATSVFIRTYLKLYEEKIKVLTA